MRLKPSCLLSPLLFVSLSSWGDGAEENADAKVPEFVVEKSLVFSDAGGGLELDLFLPRDLSEPVPCVIVIQGGGFLAQNGQRFRPFAEYLARNGFSAALTGYRGRPDHTYPDTIADLKAAVRFVKKVGADYGISPDRIGAVGRSAGATLAALLAVTGGVESLEGEGGHSGYSSRIRAAVGISGVYDFVARFESEDQKALQPKWEAKKRTNGEWIGVPFSSNSEDWIRMSATNHVDAEDPSLLLIHSKDDPIVPWLQSRDFYDAMKSAGLPSEIILSDTGGHSGPDDAKKQMVDFFKSVLVGAVAQNE